MGEIHTENRYKSQHWQLTGSAWPDRQISHAKAGKSVHKDQIRNGDQEVWHTKSNWSWHCMIQRNACITTITTISYATKYGMCSYNQPHKKALAGVTDLIGSLYRGEFHLHMMICGNYWRKWGENSHVSHEKKCNETVLLNHWAILITKSTWSPVD